VWYYQFIDASVLCGNFSSCVVSLPGVLMLVVIVSESHIFQLIKPFNKVVFDKCIYQNILIN